MFDLFKYFTIRSLVLHIGVTLIGKMFPQVLPMWLFNSTRSLVSICSAFGTLILYKKVDHFAKIFGSKFRVYVIDFIIHSIPFLYLIFYSRDFTKYFTCEEKSVFSSSYFKFVGFQVAWFIMYLMQHNPIKVYNIKKAFVVGLFVSSLGLVGGLWQCMNYFDFRGFIHN